MNTTTKNLVDAKLYDETDFYIGLGLVTISSCFIGASFIIKKKALIRLQKCGALRASSGGFGYLEEWLWWVGLLSMGIGEATNFAAYTFAPASLVTPLGALSILVSAILASRYLNEKLNLLGKIGCFLCILGSTVLVFHSPKSEEISTLKELLDKVKHPGYIIYVLLVIMSTFLIIFYLGPAYGKQNIMVYIFLCSSVGSLTVMSCKGLGLALKETITSLNNGFTNWLTWTFLFSIIICVSIQMNYLNRSLDLFETTIVTPIYYVFFTTLVIIASAILFREWENMSIEDILGSSCGFLTIIIAIFLLNAFKEIDGHYEHIRHTLWPKRKILANSNNQWNNTDEERLVKRFETELKHTYEAEALTRTI
ncbi:Magnesium transporter NIPA2 [Habropoda laboriosa]|uniref:Magnesium transporter NIPA2 n=1 Tax=Habropoda laboriosa TaxID=597456 RepID=A0A0L7RDP4_9HYME|nr:PREDICTED: magnesium transporter NIPA2 [Habropoda laboriosa]KOC68939.1 Magnesium transporter NIPA2 [Habropoda laboriosa]